MRTTFSEKYKRIEKDEGAVGRQTFVSRRKMSLPSEACHAECFLFLIYTGKDLKFSLVRNLVRKGRMGTFIHLFPTFWQDEGKIIFFFIYNRSLLTLG